MGNSRGAKSKVSNYKGFPDSSRVIGTEEASSLIGRKDVVFVDTRNYWKYVGGHIPGAVNLELYAFHWVDTSDEGMLAFAREMAMLLGAFGVDNTKTVVFYQNDSGYDAARGVWLLQWLGNGNAKLLDGGLNAWKREGRPVSKEDSHLARARFRLKLDKSVLGSIADLKRVVGSSSISVIDVRSAGEFDGTRRRAQKAGHMPGAVNLEWKDALRRDGSLKSASQLEAMYGRFSRNDPLVTYCQSGYRAAHSWLVLKLLGFEDVRNYIGSWYEWGSDPATPVVRGKV
ncbi:MAG: sulfurtransferase [Thaumarchaeota archaeon]|nr:sulfurtransferase [Nitrososphaerota archaeon]